MEAITKIYCIWSIQYCTFMIQILILEELAVEFICTFLNQEQFLYLY